SLMPDYWGSAPRTTGSAALDQPVPAPGTSPTERLFAAVQKHRSEQAATCVRLRRLLHSVGDPLAKFVLDTVVESKMREEQLLRRLEATLRDALHWSHSSDALQGRDGRLTSAGAGRGRAGSGGGRGGRSDQEAGQGLWQRRWGNGEAAAGEAGRRASCLPRAPELDSQPP